MALGGDDETIKIKFVVETQQAVQASQQLTQTVEVSTKQIIASGATLRQNVDSIKASMIELRKQTGMSLDFIADKIRKVAKVSFTDTTTGLLDKDKFNNFNKALSIATTEMKKAEGATTGFTGAIKQLGGAFQVAFGLTIVGIISKIFTGFQQLIQVGEEYAQTIYRLGVSINQLQRRGLDITIKSEIALIKELRDEYKAFSQRGIIEAVASVQMLTRNFGFSQEQIKKTTQLSLDLALVQGKGVAETAKQLALFYSSGYGEGLQHAGLAVNRMTVANEAHRMGLQKTYMELTEVERATAAYNLVTRQTVDLHKDAEKIQDSLIGQIKDQKSSIEDVTNEIALRALPIELAWLRVKRASIEAISDWLEWDRLYKEALKEEGKKFIPFVVDDSAAKKADKLMEEQRARWEEILSGTLDVTADLNLDLSGEDQELADKRAELGDKIMELWDDLQDAQQDYVDKSEELEEKHVDKLAEIDEEGLEKQREIYKDYQSDILDAREDYADKLEDIERDLAQDIADSRIDYARKLEDIDRDYRRGVEDENRKYRDNELKAERDYQEKLRRLREEFLFDLEDALRERDALQVLRLIRRYNLDKEQLEREKDLNAEERAEEHRRALEDLRRNAEEKRQDALRNLQQDIEDAQIAAQRKREDAQRALDEQLADAKESYEKARQDALDAAEQKRQDEIDDYAKRQAELDKDLQDRKDKILAAFGKEIGTTGTSLKTVSEIFTKYFGKKGEVPATIDNYIAKITEAANETNEQVTLMQGYLADLAASAEAAANSIINSYSRIPAAPSPVPGLGGGENSGWGTQPTPPSYAFGGTVYANTPTMAMFGEVPEIATFTPLSRLNTSSISPVGGISGQGGGNMKIQILLSPGLEAQIIDNSLGSMAEILQNALGVK